MPALDWVQEWILGPVAMLVALANVMLVGVLVTPDNWYDANGGVPMLIVHDIGDHPIRWGAWVAFSAASWWFAVCWGIPSRPTPEPCRCPHCGRRVSPEFREVDLVGAARAMRGSLLVDGRNFIDPDAVRSAGLVYEAIGRPSRNDSG
jgi:hypothetical protein